jgi:DNA-binding HxlR family transcriptional regulator
MLAADYSVADQADGDANESAARRHELTKLGHSLWDPVEALGRWAHEHQGQIEEAQRRS